MTEKTLQTLFGALCRQILLVRDTYSTALLKNFIVVLVWVVLSYINGTLIVIFFRHQVRTRARTRAHTHIHIVVSTMDPYV